MSRRGGDGLLFVGRLSKNIRTRDLEDVFESHGRMSRCDIKYGAEMAYAFIDFDDRRDAEDALRYENGRDILGSSIIVEWAKGNPRRPLGYDECFKCHRVGHWARDCPDDRFYGFRRPSRRSRSRSPRRRRSRSRSPRRRSRSRSPRRRSRSRSPRRQSRSPRQRSRSPRQHSRSPRQHSRSPRQHSRSPRRHRSDSRSRSKSQDRSKRSRRSRSNSGRRGGSRSRSRSRNGDTRENGDH